MSAAPVVAVTEVASGRAPCELRLPLVARWVARAERRAGAYGIAGLRWYVRHAAGFVEVSERARAEK